MPWPDSERRLAGGGQRRKAEGDPWRATGVESRDPAEEAREFPNRIDCTRDVVHACARALDDIKYRKASKAAKAARKIARQKAPGEKALKTQAVLKA